jgi:hypothetical protein
VLERAVAADPTHAACWANLVVALLSSGRPAAAREAAARATAAGIRLDPGLTAAVAAGGAS